MIELNSVNAGDKVLVKVGRNLIGCEVVEVTAENARVRSLSTGREFTTAKIEGMAARAEDAAPQEPPAEEAEAPATLETSLEEIPTGEPEKEAPAVETAETAEKPRKKLSLLKAAIEVLRLEGRPLNTRDIVKLAVDKGLWEPTGCKTPEQSLYGAFFLEIKNAEAPRVKKSAERGKFELA